MAAQLERKLDDFKGSVAELQKLERELELPLVNRAQGRSNLSLTEAGQLLLHFADRYASLSREALQALQALRADLGRAQAACPGEKEQREPGRSRPGPEPGGDRPGASGGTARGPGLSRRRRGCQSGRSRTGRGRASTSPDAGREPA